MREIFGKMSPISREIFLEMGELILIFDGVGDTMVCLVVNLAPREFFWSFFLWGREKEDVTRTRFCFGVHASA